MYSFTENYHQEQSFHYQASFFALNEVYQENLRKMRALREEHSDLIDEYNELVDEYDELQEDSESKVSYSEYELVQQARDNYQQQAKVFREQLLERDQQLTDVMIKLEAVRKLYAELLEASKAKREPTFTIPTTLAQALKVFGFDSVPTSRELRKQYRVLATKYHPDKGGLNIDMQAINKALDIINKHV